jgi:hypothetical protein
MNSQLTKRHVEFLKSRQLRTEVSLIAAIAILMLSIAAHVFDYFGVLLFADVEPILFFTEAVVFGAVSGILAAQVCLLAIWCSLGGQKGIWRIPLAITSLLLLINNWILALSVGRSSLNNGEVNVVFMGVFAVFLLVQLPLIVIRMFYKLSIAPHCLISTRNLASHFKIRDLFVLLFHAALLIVFTQIVLELVAANKSPAIYQETMNPSEMVEAIARFLVVGVCVSLISLFAFGAVFSKKYRWRIALLLLFWAIAFAVLGPMTGFFSSDPNVAYSLYSVEACQWFAFFNVVLIGELLILSVFYCLGYRVSSKRGRLITTSN